MSTDIAADAITNTNESPARMLIAPRCSQSRRLRINGVR